MDQSILGIAQGSLFESIRKVDAQDREYWEARELYLLLGYDQWRNFSLVLEKARKACETSGHIALDHFADVSKTIQMPKSAEKEVEDYRLTRYACYLIAQNGDPRKRQIALAQTYFAVQTRKQEVTQLAKTEVDRLKARKELTESESAFSQMLFEKGFQGYEYGKIRSDGDKALMSKTTKQIKEEFGISDHRPIADFLPTPLVKAKEFAATVTNYQVQTKGISNKGLIHQNHIENNRGAKRVLQEAGLEPSTLLKDKQEDIKKIQRKALRISQ